MIEERPFSNAVLLPVQPTRLPSRQAEAGGLPSTLSSLPANNSIQQPANSRAQIPALCVLFADLLKLQKPKPRWTSEKLNWRPEGWMLEVKQQALLLPASPRNTGAKTQRRKNHMTRRQPKSTAVMNVFGSTCFSWWSTKVVCSERHVCMPLRKRMQKRKRVMQRIAKILWPT